ncbi:MAG: dUTP diphosphatase [Gemmatimonadaceae bacterium]
MTAPSNFARPRVRVRRLPHGLETPLPAPATSGAAGFDVCSAEPDFTLGVGDRRAVATGLVFELPLGIEMQVRPRSGLALTHGITVPNAPGTIDPDYRGELKILMQNLGAEAVTIHRGDRIAQLVFARYELPQIEESSELSATMRGADGFGSTGR